MNKNAHRITTGGNMALPGQTRPVDIVLRQPRRFDIDIADFTQAVRAAENVDFSRRARLYDLYTDILTDAHLSSVIDRRMAAVTAAEISFVRDGVPDAAINEQIESPWFLSLVQDILDTRFWGFSLLQFYREGGWIGYDLIPRKHVDPVRRLILHRQEDLNGRPWDDYPHLLPIGRQNDLGLLLKAVPWVVYKRNDVADWAQFCEVFGMPIREYVYDTDDDEARARAVKDAEDEGSLAAFIHGRDTELRLVESAGKSGSADLYERLCQRCNNELSKLILGNTLTTEAQDKGTQALGTVHKTEEDKLFRGDRRYILNVLNYEMTDIFRAMGINTQGGKFVFVDAKYGDLTTKINILSRLRTTFSLPVDDDYLYNEFGIEKPENYEALKAAQAAKGKAAQQPQQPEPTPIVEPEPAEETDEGERKKSKKRESASQAKKKSSALRRIRSMLARFFGQAPHAGADLSW